MKMEVGKNYFVRTVTDYWVGRLVSVDGPYTVTLTDFAWVCETGRLSVFLDTGKAPGMEVEAAPGGMQIQCDRVAILDWPHPLFRESV